MKNIIKRNNGITMISLVITIMILLILTNMLIYNAKDSIHIKALTNLYNDIDLLKENVASYYNEYGQIPASEQMKYKNTEQLKSANILSINDDIEEFYIIDLEAMKGITLNYGKDYRNIKNNIGLIDDYTDVYVINKKSHNIFYVQGINIKENNTIKTYYTNYTKPDNTIVDLRYIDGILIPEGYYYIGKETDNSGNESIVISKNKNEEIDSENELQYKWQKQISNLETIPSSIILSDTQNESSFLRSVNNYKGYFKNKNTNIIYLPIDEDKWSESYTEECEYKDENGDIAYIPKDFKVSTSVTMNTIAKGLVAKDKMDNEWVWIEVPKSIFKNVKELEEADQNNKSAAIKKDLEEYTKSYRIDSSVENEGWIDKHYEKCGVSEEKYNQIYNKMLSSIYKNGGFWISRYEIGDSKATETNTTRTNMTGITGRIPVSKTNQIPYNNVTVEEAQTLASQMIENPNRTSSLLFGIQWDLVCKFLEGKENLKQYDINEDSKYWGNYNNKSLKITSTDAKQLEADSNIWTTITQIKPANSILLTTGAARETSKMNIYDFSGNTFEWTLEKSPDVNELSVARGGSYRNSGEEFPACVRKKNNDNTRGDYVSFRCTIY